MRRAVGLVTLPVPASPLSSTSTVNITFCPLIVVSPVKTNSITFVASL
ncbi:MAG TPA: hypothetical protein VFR12_02735 [Pyrinomonadaceae bacterium]|nr:hypothetical protein [Pyrinomonadaceae bacterium]